MNIGSTKEDVSVEKRIAITPQNTEKLINIGTNVFIEKDYGKQLGFENDDFIKKGAKILEDVSEIYKKCELILKVNLPKENELEFLKEGTSIVGNFHTTINKKEINNILNKEVKIISLDLLPRITRAQSMDILSSQANLAGYRAVIESLNEFEKAVPMMMTAAGTVPPAKVLVIGTGVAGLQAIATAKRIGAIVSATDIRSAAKEQVESLGAKFLAVDSNENLETKEGYAKETGEDYKKKQEILLKKNIINYDIIICTALIPGKKAPRIITEDMIKSLKPGSIIFDLAVEQGGNSAFSEGDKVVNINRVKIISFKNIMNKIPLTASILYSNNIFNFVKNFYNKEKKTMVFNKEDEIINKTMVTKEL